MTFASSDPRLDRSIALVGMMGAGKTSIGRALAERLGRPFVDLDEEVERAADATIPDLFRRDGEAAFRELEHRALARLLHRPALILATGGGAVLDPRSRALLRESAFTIWLDAEPASLAARIDDTATRPLLVGDDPEARLGELLAERQPLYAEAHLRIDTDGCDAAEVLERLLTALASCGQRPKA